MKLKSFLALLNCWAAFFLFASTVFAHEELSLTVAHEYNFPISEECPQQSDKPIAPRTYQLTIWGYLKNVSDKPIKVATAINGGIINLGGEINSAELMVSSEQGPLEIKVVPAEAELRIVVLKPGESALFKWQRRGRRTDLKIDQLKVTFHIDQIIASRFGLWEGTVSAESKRVQT